MSVGSIDAVLTHQALVVGRVSDAITGHPPFDLPTVVLWYAETPGVPSRRFPLTARVLPDGLFVFGGDPLRAFPVIPVGSTLDLHLEVTCIGYQQRRIAISISHAELAPLSDVLTVRERRIDVVRLDAPVRDLEIALSPLPVHLAGRVVSSDDPSQPIGGAEVRVVDIDGIRLVGSLWFEHEDSPVVVQDEAVGQGISMTGDIRAGSRRLPLEVPAVLPQGTVLRVQSTPGMTEYVTLAADGSSDIREPGMRAAHSRSTTQVQVVTLTDAAAPPPGSRNIVGIVGPGSRVFEVNDVGGLSADQVVRIGTGATREFQIIETASPFGPVQSDANGFFVLERVPVRPDLPIRVSRAGFQTLDAQVSLDFRQPVNQQTFALSV